jgi:hypothetical protein
MTEEHRQTARSTPAPAGDTTNAPRPQPEQGEPADSLTGVEQALVKAAKDTPPATADPLVSVAFALGWQMAELYRPQQRRHIAKSGADLPGLGSLNEHEHIEILTSQVQAGVATLAGKVNESGLPAVDLSPLTDYLENGEPEIDAAVEKVHKVLLRTLIAADFRLGKAYGLGRALADTCREPTDGASIARELGAYRVANLRGWLDDLSSALPPHAAHSVSTSLQSWVTWAKGMQDPQEIAAAPIALRRQGELWRALLSGEKKGTEMLEIANYLDAARSLADQMHTVIRGVIGRFPIILWAAAGLLVLGLALLIIGGSSATVAGAGSILAALGVIWKGLGGALGQLTAKLEQPLWGAVLDNAIAAAITLKPENEADKRGRLADAMAMAGSRGVDETSKPAPPDPRLP